jgi:hypothetical protein
MRPLKRPYTFVIIALLIAIFGVASVLTTPTDILPDINIPIVSVIWAGYTTNISVIEQQTLPGPGRNHRSRSQGRVAEGSGTVRPGAGADAGTRMEFR